MVVKFKINSDDLEIRPFSETPNARDINDFNCGNENSDIKLNDFINTDQAYTYEKAGFGRTYLVYYHDEFVAYFTLSCDSLKKKKIDSKKILTETKKPNGGLPVESFPALKIGRLAVEKILQKKGIGPFILSHIIGRAKNIQKQVGLRLITVNVEQGRVGFYGKFGFHLVRQDLEKKRRERTMYLDIHGALTDTIKK